MSFSHLGLSDKVLAAVAATGYTTPTPIQEQAIPHVLARRDVLGIAQTGTGKTAAFVLPMLTMLEKGRARARMPRTLILEPTRELAAQVKENFDKYGIGQKLNVALLIGGVSFGDQDVDAAGQLGVLVAEGDAADEQGDAQLVVDAIFDEIVFDLGGELTRRLEDERARHAGAGPAFLQHGQHGQRKGRRLAGAGLGDACLLYTSDAADE